MEPVVFSLSRGNGSRDESCSGQFYPLFLCMCGIFESDAIGSIAVEMVSDAVFVKWNGRYILKHTLSSSYICYISSLLSLNKKFNLGIP